MSAFLDWFDALPDGTFFAIVLLLWLAACFAIAGIFGLVARYGRGQFDHAEMIERAREQRRRELQR
jgi:hypothetical protein